MRMRCHDAYAYLRVSAHTSHAFGSVCVRGAGVSLSSGDTRDGQCVDFIRSPPSQSPAHTKTLERHERGAGPCLAGPLDITDRGRPGGMLVGRGSWRHTVRVPRGVATSSELRSGFRFHSVYLPYSVVSPQRSGTHGNRNRVMVVGTWLTSHNSHAHAPFHL